MQTSTVYLHPTIIERTWPLNLQKNMSKPFCQYFLMWISGVTEDRK